MRRGSGDPGDAEYSSSASTLISTSEGRAVTRGSSTSKVMEDSGVEALDIRGEERRWRVSSFPSPFYVEKVGAEGVFDDKPLLALGRTPVLGAPTYCQPWDNPST
jgi:hypothetical protein